MRDFKDFDWADINNEAIFVGDLSLSSDQYIFGSGGYLAYISVGDSGESLEEEELEEFIGACQSLLAYIKKKNNAIKIFVAGHGANRHIVKNAMLCVEQMGHIVTHDWTASPGWDDPSKKDLEAEAIRDAQAIDEADALLWVWDENNPSLGASYEAGLAHGQGKPVAIAWSRWVAPAPNDRKQLYTLTHKLFGDAKPAVDYLAKEVAKKKEASK